MKTPAKKSGFTLIEIVIVLAIAALIVVIVFAAVSGAQRSRRDTDRKSAANQALAAVQQFYSANNNTAPANGSTLSNYINTLKDPSSGSGYTVNVMTTPTAPTNSNIINIGQGGCNGNAFTSGSGWAALYYQENGGSGCISIQ